MRPPARLVDAAVAVYPERVRDRYGAEIADLVAASPRPWRDLGDVVWNATLERAGSVRLGDLRPYSGQMVALVTFPAVFWVVMLVLALPVYLGVFGVARLVGVDTAAVGVFLASGAALVGLVAALASGNARRWVDSLDVPAPALLVPTLLGLGCLGTGVLPPTLLILRAPGMWAALPTTVACWWLVVVASGARFRALVRQGRPGAARRLAVAATTVALAVTGTAHMATSAATLDRELTFAYLMPTGSPSLLVVCTPFTFAILSALTPRVTAGCRP